MRNDQRGPAPTPGPATHPSHSSVAAATDARGEWPSSPAALRAKWKREHTRRTWAYSVIKEHLAQQPSTGSMWTAARLWCRDITLAADALAQERQDQEHNQ